MTLHGKKQRFYAALIILGASILLYRTISMLVFEDALELLMLWVIVLLFLEMAIDVACIATAIPWWVSDDRNKASLPLRFGAAAALFHAFRVLIYVLGRTGPWVDFDLRPEHRGIEPDQWTWISVYFAATLSVLGIIGVIVIWRLRRRAVKGKSSVNRR